MKIRETCGCGASIELDVAYATGRDALESFAARHVVCLVRRCAERSGALSTEHPERVRAATDPSQDEPQDDGSPLRSRSATSSDDVQEGSA